MSNIRRPAHWTGPWKDQTSGGDALCHALVFEEVFPNGYARVIYGHGTYEGGKIRQPDFWRATGRIVDGVLRAAPQPDFGGVRSSSLNFSQGSRSSTLGVNQT
jgi:hypothetical protein